MDAPIYGCKIFLHRRPAIWPARCSIIHFMRDGCADGEIWSRGSVETSMGFAIILTLVATTLARVGIVLLKQAVARLAGQSLRGIGPLAMALLQSNLGLLGIGMQIAGIGLYLLAVSEPSAPISVLQPLRTFGILVMAFLCVVFLKEQLGPLDWLGVILQVVGILLLGMSLTSIRQQTGVIVASPIIVHLIALGIVSAACALVLCYTRHQPLAEVAYGVLAGLLLGAAYLNMKVFFLARQGARLDIEVLSLAVIGLGSIGGFAVLLWSFRTCRALIVTTISFVLNQLTVVIGGAVCLGEELPAEPLLFWARVVGISAILLGVVLLARFLEAKGPAPRTPPFALPTMEQAPPRSP